MGKRILTNYKYIKDDITKDWLKQNGFRYSRMLSDPESIIYIKRFPIIIQNNRIVIEGEFAVDLVNLDVSVFVYEIDSYERKLYPQYYNREYGNTKPLIEKIDKEIIANMKKYNIHKKEKKNERQNCKVRKN